MRLQALISNEAQINSGCCHPWSKHLTAAKTKQNPHSIAELLPSVFAVVTTNRDEPSETQVLEEQGPVS